MHLLSFSLYLVLHYSDALALGEAINQGLMVVIAGDRQALNIKGSRVSGWQNNHMYSGESLGDLRGHRLK